MDLWRSLRLAARLSMTKLGMERFDFAGQFDEAGAEVELPRPPGR